jgi:DNA-binding transcriptional regulator GbsR (MarR family)
MNTLYPAAVGFIEQISLLAESAGFPRIGGLFSVQEEPLSFDELVSLLQISRGSASINTRLLEARSVLRRSCRLGERSGDVAQGGGDHQPHGVRTGQLQ